MEELGRCLTLEVECAVVEDKEKADMGKFLGRRTGAGEDAEVERAGRSSSSSSSVSGVVSMSALRSRHTAWKPPCSQARSPLKPSFLNFRRRPCILEESGIAFASAS